MALSRSMFVCGLTMVTVLSLDGGTLRLSAQETAEYIVQFQDGTAPAARRAAAASAGAGVRFVYAGVSAAALRVPNQQALAALQRNPAVVAIVPNRQVTAFQKSNAKGGKPGGGGEQSQVMPLGVARVGAPTAGSSGAGVGVAIIDTGIDLAHADLTGAVDAFNAFGGSCQDDEGHGTHVAGSAAARDNSVDVVGVAPDAALYCVKVLDQTGSGSDATVMAGLDWVRSNHANVTPAIRVVNMSLGRAGSVDDNPALRDLVAAVDAAGISIVVAAGNDPNLETSQQIPAAYAQVISVASTTAATGSNLCRNLSSPIAADTASYFTTDGPGVTVSAPGEEQENVNRGCFINSVGVLSTRLGGGTTRLSGTSMASPHVAGVAARHYQLYPSASPADVKGWIASDADRKGAAPLNSPTSSYTYDGILEGIAQAPQP